PVGSDSARSERQRADALLDAFQYYDIARGRGARENESAAIVRPGITKNATVGKVLVSRRRAQHAEERHLRALERECRVVTAVNHRHRPGQARREVRLILAGDGIL